MQCNSLKHSCLCLCLLSVSVSVVYVFKIDDECKAYTIAGIARCLPSDEHMQVSIGHTCTNTQTQRQHASYGFVFLSLLALFFWCHSSFPSDSHLPASPRSTCR